MRVRVIKGTVFDVRVKGEPVKENACIRAVRRGGTQSS